jgi:hypothetical protein
MYRQATYLLTYFNLVIQTHVNVAELHIIYSGMFFGNMKFFSFLRNVFALIFVN